MEISTRALVTQFHGMLFGAFFLMALCGVVVELCRSMVSTSPSSLTARGAFLEKLYLILTAALGWAAVFSGA